MKIFFFKNKDAVFQRLSVKKSLMLNLEFEWLCGLMRFLHFKNRIRVYAFLAFWGGFKASAFCSILCVMCRHLWEQLSLWVKMPLFFTSKQEQDRWCHSFPVVFFDQGEWTSVLRRTGAQRKRREENTQLKLWRKLCSLWFPPARWCFVNVLKSRSCAKTPAADSDITHVYVCEISGPHVLCWVWGKWTGCMMMCLFAMLMRHDT